MTDFEETLKMLKDTYGKSTLTKEEIANELNLSVSTISNRISQGYDLPNYKKLGPNRCDKVVFPIVELAKYLTRTVKVS